VVIIREPREGPRSTDCVEPARGGFKVLPQVVEVMLRQGREAHALQLRERFICSEVTCAVWFEQDTDEALWGARAQYQRSLFSHEQR
jgi:hypothetical protein